MTDKSPYQQALDAVRSVAYQKHKESPASPMYLLVEEAFSTFHEFLGKSTDEEELTALFLGAWTSSQRYWERHWPWTPEFDISVMSLPFNKTSETRLGADFALVLARSAFDIKIVVAQAKKFNSVEPGSQNVERWAFTSKGGQFSALSKEARAALANRSLREVLRSAKKESPLTTPEWQLTRFIWLEDSLKKVLSRLAIEPGGKGCANHVSCGYVSWPTKSAVAPRWTALRDVKAELAGFAAAHPYPKPITQTYNLKERSLVFRDFLIGLDDANSNTGLNVDQAATLLDAIKERCKKLVVLDVNVPGIANDLTNRLGLTNSKSNPTDSSKPSEFEHFKKTIAPSAVFKMK